MRRIVREVAWLGPEQLCPPTLQARLAQHALAIHLFHDEVDFWRHVSAQTWAVVRGVADLHDLRAGLQLPRQLWQAQRRPAPILIMRPRRLAWLDLAWRSGACDVVVLPTTEVQLVHRIVAAAEAWEPIGAALAAAHDFLQRRAQLSPRERMVLKGLAEGSWLKRLANQWGTSPNTVRNQRSMALAKLGQSQTDALRGLWDAEWLERIGRLRGWQRPAEARPPRGP